MTEIYAIFGVWLALEDVGKKFGTKLILEINFEVSLRDISQRVSEIELQVLPSLVMSSDFTEFITPTKEQKAKRYESRKYLIWYFYMPWHYRLIRPFGIECAQLYVTSATAAQIYILYFEMRSLFENNKTMNRHTHQKKVDRPGEREQEREAEREKNVRCFCVEWTMETTRERDWYACREDDVQP